MRTQEKMKRLQDALREAGIQANENRIQRCDWTEKKGVLSSEQQRIWILQQFDQSGFAYNIPVALRVRGTMQKELLEQSVDQLIRKHHILRTTFGEINGEPYQKLHEHFHFRIEEYRCLEDEKGNQEKVNDKIKHFLQAPFDLQKLPLFRMMLIYLNEKERILLLCIHHIIADGWSTGIIANEISANYARFSEHRSCVEPELPIQYMDYAFWEQGHREQLKADIGYWKERLSYAPQELFLPQKKQKYTEQIPVGAYESFFLSKKITDLLKEIATSRGTTLYVMLLAVLAIQLGRYSGQNDIVIGSPVAGRQKVDTEKLIGLFVNTLPLRIQMQENCSFLTFIDKLKVDIFRDFAHQAVPFEMIVEELKVERDVNKTPLFQVMFTLQNTPMPPLKLPDAVLEIEDMDIGISQFALSLTLREEEQGLKGFFEYDTTLFDRENILTMCQHFVQLTEYYTTLPESSIKTAPMLTEEEREKMRTWNRTACKEQEEVIHQIFYKQVCVRPENVAVIFENTQITYRETYKRASCMASVLLSHGISREERVGIYMEYSLNLLPAILGVLMAGGAYVPIDTTYPDSRVDYIIKDSGINLVLTQTSMLPSIVPLGVTCICCDEFEKAELSEEACLIDKKIDAKQLACIIYTSGSTGVPKGVMLHHRGIANMMWSFVESYGADERDRMMPLTSIASSSFIGELLPLICTGGGVVLVSREDMLDSDKLFAAMVDRQVSIISSVPSLLTKLCERGRSVSSLRLILSGGEAFQPDDFAKLSPNVQVVNSYGLTETTVCSSYIKIPHESISRYDGGAVGKPIRNTEILILDGYHNQLPIGCPGEIYISGIGVAKGYLNHPELTKRAFLPHINRKEKVMYKTGDLGYWGKDGNLYYIGRLDNQIKIRGYRIETGEVEKILRSSGKVREVTVIPQKVEDKYTALTACIVLEKGESADAIRRWAADRLPVYMRPAHYLILDELPRNPNGKVDRAALAKFEVMPSVIHERPWGRKTKTQEIIYEIWKEVLHMEINSPDDNFFELGGHSLLLMQVHHQMKTRIEREVAVIDLLKYPTIALLSEFIDGQQDEEEKRGQLEVRINDRIHKARNAVENRRDRMKRTIR